MKELPILFSAPMVRALLDGSKTQTRRVVKLRELSGSYFEGGAAGVGFDGFHIPRDAGAAPAKFSAEAVGGGAYLNEEIYCPYGAPGDRLWVREAYADIGCRLTYRADEDDGAHCKVKKWTPSIHMFRADSRILLEIVSVRVERLNDCSEADAIAEGIIENADMRPADSRLPRFWRDYRLSGDGTFCTRDPIRSYSSLWENINGVGSWDANPWVWAIAFKRVAP